MRTVTTLVFLSLLCVSSARAQSGDLQPAAEQTIQPSQTIAASPQPSTREFKIPAGTAIDVEVAYTVNSLDLKAGELISFRVLVPLVIDGVVVIEKGALVTARITQAKRGAHWGRAGKLSWEMEDVIGADNSRIPLSPETSSRNDKLWSLEAKTTKSGTAIGSGGVTGTSHAGEIATKTIVAGALFPPLAPLALIYGFRRGENAILREGRRFVVAVGKDTLVKGTVVVLAP